MIDEITEYRKLYDTADRFVREVGEYRDDLDIPALNQLRYAGHHFLKAVDEDGQVSDMSELSRARVHCQRAMYDASEAGIQQAIREIQDFRDEFREIVVTDVVADYLSIVAGQERATKVIVAGRAERESAERQAGEYMELFRGLRESVGLLDAARDDLNAKKLAIGRERRRYNSHLALIALAALASLAIATSNFMGLFH